MSCVDTNNPRGFKQIKTSGSNVSLWSKLCVFVVAEYAGRGVPYGSRIAVWRRLFQRRCSPLSKCGVHGDPLRPLGGKQVLSGGRTRWLPSSPPRQSHNSLGTAEWLFAPGLCVCAEQEERSRFHRVHVTWRIVKNIHTSTRLFLFAQCPANNQMRRNIIVLSLWAALTVVCKYVWINPINPYIN